MRNFNNLAIQRNSQKIQKKIIKEFYNLIRQNVIKWHPVAILRSWRFFWHPYWNIHSWHISDSIHVNYVTFVIYGVNDIYGIGLLSWMNMSIWCQKNHQDLRISAGCNSITFWRIKSEEYQNTKFHNFPLYFLRIPL